MTCFYPEYAVGIRAYRLHSSDAFAQPRCIKTAIHGAKIGAWERQNGQRITHWERVSP